VTATPQEYAGERFGLPRTGHASVAGWGRRLLALSIDWMLSMLFVAAFLGSSVWTAQGLAQWAPLLVFAAERWVLTSLLGGSAGQLVLGMRVVRTGGGRLDPVRALVRTALVCLVIPAVIFNSDRQGLHDLVADSIVVRR
jgi:uncharacterized RDD family membrane protein YckC